MTEADTAAQLVRPVVLHVNGGDRALDLPPGVSLLSALRNDLGLSGPKYGCGCGECGSCTVLVDGVAARACVIPAAGVTGRAIVTLEGLPARAGCPSGTLHPVQQAFVDAAAAQCGYCLNGMVVTTVALLEREPSPSDSRIRAALSGNLCRCGTHLEILAAVRLAVERGDPCRAPARVSQSS